MKIASPRLASVALLATTLATAQLALADVGKGVPFVPAGSSAKQITGGVLQTAKKRLVVGVGGYGERGALIAVDIDNGNRTLFSGVPSGSKDGAKPVGSGPDFENIRAVVATSSSLWVLGSKANSGRLTQVDAKNGDRTKQLKMEDNPVCKYLQLRPNSLAVGPGDKLFSLFVSSSENGLMSVDVSGDKPNCEVISSEKKGSGPKTTGNISALAFGAGAFWFVDSTNAALYKVDPSSGARTVVGRVNGAEIVGDGPKTLASSGATFANGSLWLVGNVIGSRAGTPIVSVDPASGKRTTYKDGDGPTVREEAESQLWVLPSSEVVVSQSERLLKYNPKTRAISVFSEP
jgi:hypothetical protein